jgi:hypothetical protein
MPEVISWHQALKPAWRWLLRRLPAILFAKWYNSKDLEKDIEITLNYSDALDLYLPKQRGAPALRFSAKVRNASPYLDIRVKRVSVTLSVGGGEYEELFAEAHDWSEFDVPCGESQLCQLTTWPNEFQTQIVRTCNEGKVPVSATVYVSVESAIGKVISWKIFRRIPLTVK